MTTDVEFSPELLVATNSGISEVYKSQYNPNYNFRSKLFGKDLVVDAYTTDMEMDAGGWIEFKLLWNSGKTKTIGKPMHRIVDGVLYALKKNKQWESDAFALNHELFGFEWESSVILHFYNGAPVVFLSSREEWLKTAYADHRNQETQVFMEVPDYRRLSISMMPDGGKEWLKRCLAWAGKNR